MNKNKNMAREQHEEENALVIWNISYCPIPDGHDPLQVVTRIQTALEKLRRDRPYGPLSITAISDNLTEIPGEDAMRKLSSTGISLKHANRVQTDLYQWSRRNPPPATIMVITGHEELEHLGSTFSGLEVKGYRILPTYPQPNPAPPSLPKLCFWETLLSDADNKLETTSRLVFSYRLDRGTGESPWSCSVCHFDAPSFEDFTKHLKSETHAYFVWDRVASKNKVDRTNPDNLQLGRSEVMCLNHIHLKNKNMAREQHEEENALVIWNISNCPIPDGHDPLQVVPRIQTALEKLRRDRPYGPLSITAISNNLTEIPGEDVMRKLSSTGISLKHAHGVQTDLYQWASRNPPPATIMVITGHEELEHLGSTFSGLEEEGYIILPTYPQPNPAPPCMPKLCFWETLLSDADNKLVTTSRLIFHGTGGYPWSCSVCYFDAPILEDFTNHLKSETHAYFEWDRFASKNKIDRTNPANMQLGRSQEWDLLAKPDMIRRAEVLKLRGAFAPPRSRPVDANSFKEPFKSGE